MIFVFIGFVHIHIFLWRKFPKYKIIVLTTRNLKRKRSHFFFNSSWGEGFVLFPLLPPPSQPIFRQQCTGELIQTYNFRITPIFNFNFLETFMSYPAWKGFKSAFELVLKDPSIWKWKIYLVKVKIGGNQRKLSILGVRIFFPIFFHF